MTDIYLYGSGGHSKVILDILLKQHRQVTAFVDDSPTRPTLHNIPIHPTDQILASIPSGGDSKATKPTGSAV
jgi:hypothetical protein